MRVLQIAPPWFPVPPTGYGGTEQVVSLLADGLARRGHDVTLLAAGGSHSEARLLTTYSQPPSPQLGNPTIELAHVLAGYHERDAFDVVHDHTMLGAAVGSVPGGPPVVHTLHGAWTPDAVRLYGRIQARVHLVAISHDQAGRAPPGVRIASVVHNGIDVGAHRLVTGAGGYLAFVGRANAQKGPRDAIEVARRLGWPLKMAVKVNEPNEHDYFATYLAPAVRRGEVEIVPVDSHEAKVELLGGAAALLFPITWPEPFGLVPVEANACGTPVVAFAEGAMPEVIEPGRSGLLVPTGDLDAFCGAVERAVHLDRPTCRRVVADRFDAERMVAGYEQIFQRLVAGRGDAELPGGVTVTLPEVTPAETTGSELSGRP